MNTETRCVGLGCLLLMNICIGGLSINYVLETLIGKHVSFAVAGIAGLFFGQFAVPLAILCWILRACGLHVPFFHIS